MVKQHSTSGEEHGTAFFETAKTCFEYSFQQGNNVQALLYNLDNKPLTQVTHHTITSMKKNDLKLCPANTSSHLANEEIHDSKDGRCHDLLSVKKLPLRFKKCQPKNIGQQELKLWTYMRTIGF